MHSTTNLGFLNIIAGDLTEVFLVDPTKLDFEKAEFLDLPF
jgi:hypothetical protein